MLVLDRLEVVSQGIVHIARQTQESDRGQGPGQVETDVILAEDDEARSDKHRREEVGEDVHHVGRARHVAHKLVGRVFCLVEVARLHHFDEQDDEQGDDPERGSRDLVDLLLLHETLDAVGQQFHTRYLAHGRPVHIYLLIDRPEEDDLSLDELWMSLHFLGLQHPEGRGREVDVDVVGAPFHEVAVRIAVGDLGDEGRELFPFVALRQGVFPLHIVVEQARHVDRSLRDIDKVGEERPRGLGVADAVALPVLQFLRKDDVLVLLRHLHDGVVALNVLALSLEDAVHADHLRVGGLDVSQHLGDLSPFRHSRQINDGDVAAGVGIAALRLYLVIDVREGESGEGPLDGGQVVHLDGDDGKQGHDGHGEQRHHHVMAPPGPALRLPCRCLVCFFFFH